MLMTDVDTYVAVRRATGFQLKACEGYLRSFAHFATTRGDTFFVSCRGSRLSHTIVAETFHAVVKAAGLPREPGRPGPRLMDLRHTFAVRGLQTCPNAREHVGWQVLALTTYMDHAKVESTYWYLESTPELLADIAQRCEAFVTGGDQ